ncbi:MAG: contact-dependent growth inhibition system immunity protein, partial [Nocardioides sp.]
IQVPVEIDALLANHSSESELKSFVDSTGAEFLPVTYEGGYREWLSEIGRRCREGMPGVERRMRERGTFPGTR